MPLIKNGTLVEDDWARVIDGAPLPDADALLLPLDVWQDTRDALIASGKRLGILLAADQPPELIAGDIDRFDLVALDFPTFKDGRAYSYARLLRERHGYTKELRAVGHVLRDQFSFMRRCGFDAFEVADGASAEHWARAMTEISRVYQPATDRRRTIATLRHRRSATSTATPGEAAPVSSWA
ncbi:MAG: DUF934 domain-containing protein [Pseudomonadota bacterium]